MRDESKPALFSVEQAATELSVSPWSIRAWVRHGAIQTTRLGRRVLIPCAEIERIATDGLASIRPERGTAA